MDFNDFIKTIDSYLENKINQNCYTKEILSSLSEAEENAIIIGRVIYDSEKGEDEKSQEYIRILKDFYQSLDDFDLWTDDLGFGSLAHNPSPIDLSLQEVIEQIETFSDSLINCYIRKMLQSIRHANPPSIEDTQLRITENHQLSILRSILESYLAKGDINEMKNIFHNFLKNL